MLLLKDLENFTLEDYLEICKKLTSFTDSDVEEEMMEQASIYSYYYGLMSAAKKNAQDLGVDLTSAESSHRKLVKSESSVKLTAKDLDDAVFSAPFYVSMEKAVNEANYKYEMLKGLVRALEQRKDMLIQVSANKRGETRLYS